MEDKRTTYIAIGGKEYPMTFSVRAAQKVAERFGGLENIGTAFTEGGTMAALESVVWLLHLLIVQGVTRKNLLEGTNDQTISEDDLFTLLDVADLGVLQGKVMEAITAGAAREVQIRADEKNGEATQGE